MAHQIYTMVSEATLSRDSTVSLPTSKPPLFLFLPSFIPVGTRYVISFTYNRINIQNIVVTREHVGILTAKNDIMPSSFVAIM